ncbi:MAG: lysophospholipid acyltransferase family protein [bacterium]|nr:lysophospholipid acyltransferase family protein [bacterium]
MNNRERLSYAAPKDSKLKRGLMELIEIVTGRPKLDRLYKSLDPESDLNIWEQIVKVLEIDVDFDQERLNILPAEGDGPLVIVANHPFGVVDGILICYLASLRRKNFKILTNNVLCAIPGVEQYFLPVEFSTTREAIDLNVRTRQEALTSLDRGEAILIFPGGAVSTAKKPFGVAEDPDWNPFTSKLILKSKAKVVPIFFAGQNSRLFQIASHINPSLRLSLLLNEITNKIGTKIRVRIGDAISHEELKNFPTRKELMSFLRDHTYSLKEQAEDKKKRKQARKEAERILRKGLSKLKKQLNDTKEKRAKSKKGDAKLFPWID